MRTLVRHGLAALLALAIAGCSSKTTTTPNAAATASPTPGVSTDSTTVTASSAGQTVTLTDQTGNVIVLTVPEAAGTVLLGTMLTVGVTQTAPAGAPASVGRRIRGTRSPLVVGAFDDFLSISATQSYTLTAPPGIVITGTSTLPFAAGTYIVQLGVVGGSSYTSLGTATLASNVLTFDPSASGTPPQFPIATGTTYIIQISM